MMVAPTASRTHPLLLYLHTFSVESQNGNKTSFQPTHGETGLAVLSTKTKVLGKYFYHSNAAIFFSFLYLFCNFLLTFNL